MNCRFALLFASLAVSFHYLQGSKENAEIVYPQRLHHKRDRRDLRTVLKDKEHEDTLSIKIPTTTGDLILDLERNDEIYPGTIRLRTYDAEGKPKQEDYTPHNCHYHGTVRDDEDSHAFISTCHGLTGTIEKRDGRYDIELHDEEGAHKLYNVDDEVDNILQKLTGKSFVVKEKEEETNDGLKTGHLIKETTDVVKTVVPFELINVGKQYIPYLTTNNTRYVEMLISTDHKMYEKYGNDTDRVLERILNCVGQVDKSYSAINVRLVVVAVEVQMNVPSFNRSKSGGTDLGNFNGHVNRLKDNDLKDISIDNAQFFSDYSWKDGVAGMAWVGTICTHISAGVNMWYYTSISGPIVILGHEFGHNMNFPHDASMKTSKNEACTCLTRRGCFMGGSKSSRPGFTDCNLERLAKKTFACLNSYPLNPLTQKCGNGIIEKGEECDCGTPENCLKNDPCCKPYDCKLKEEAQCNFVNTPECCNKQCQFKEQGTMCRLSTTSCDAPEYCTGATPTCPDDEVRADGTPCGESKKLILGTSAKKHRAMRELSPRVTAKHFKLIPKYWTKDGWACMQIEMLGCGPKEDATVPTSLHMPGLYYTGAKCIYPDITSCENVNDGTAIKYKDMKKNDCNQPHMLFTYEADGTLTHKCSGKKVCPDSTNQLMLSSACEADNSKYERIDGWSLRHKKTNNCVVPMDGWPNNNDNLKISSWCVDTTYNRLKIMMRNIDCDLPFGFENEKVPTSAFSSSESNTPLDNIRIGGDAWCPNSKKDGGWIQVNFEKNVEVHAIEIQGTWWNSVTGFYLMYSENGKLWKYYKETGPGRNDTNSHCYKGECSLTYEHQCRNLWSAGAKSASDACWDDLNTRTDGYGTCSPLEIKKCDASNVKCGQIQCLAPEDEPYYLKYGDNYTKLTVGEEKCSAAIVVGKADDPGIGMVDDGTQCGVGKICVEQQCKTLKEHGVNCPIVNGKECGENGRGYCLSNDKCHCDSGYDPETNCATMAAPVNGRWKMWSQWTSCSKACGSGKHRRHRFCDDPPPKHGGKYCIGDRVEEVDCNVEPCIVGSTCKDIKIKMEQAGRPVMDGVYQIEIKDGLNIDVYCDMTRNGGGWTLIVSSHTNSWTPENVKLRNEDKPDLYKDYSIMEYGNYLKDDKTNEIKDTTFQYRLEANAFGLWGGIWKAPISYDVASTKPNQQDVTLLDKFSEWEYSSSGIEARLPYIKGQRITTNDGSSGWGSITDNENGLHPSKWISGSLKMGRPEHVWYWIREGDYVKPTSCLDLMYRGYNAKRGKPSGVYKIEPEPGKVVETYCDFDRHGGGWTLLLKTSSQGGWNAKNIMVRNPKDGAAEEYSIYGLLPELRGNDAGESSYNYMLEADGDDSNGGIFEMPTLGYPSNCNCLRHKPKVITQFGNWDILNENIGNYPLCTNHEVLFGTVRPEEEELFASTNAQENGKKTGGVLIGKGGEGVYMKNLKKPTTIKMWVRAGGSRKSCNDLRIHGYHKGKDDYKDGFYMMAGGMTLYCDMTATAKEGWTLLITAASNGWTRQQVLMRNKDHPSLHKDYSILDLADGMKAMSNGQSFKYMMDAKERRHWGGIWKAPISYSFASTDKGREDVDILQKFSEWNYLKAWYLGPCKRMPYLEPDVKGNHGLLTTASSPTSWEWGTIVSGNKTDGHIPSKWIPYTEASSPGIIWYWLNENDCDDNYSRIDGKHTEWTMWTSCSVFCGGDGIQSRERTCTDPKPRCGGKDCDPSEETRQEKTCNTPCQTTRIQTKDGDYCFAPKKGGCTLSANTQVVLRSGNSASCKGNESLFVFNPNKRGLTHFCSQKKVCFDGLGWAASLRIGATKCPDAAFQRTIYHAIQYGSMFADPYGGRVGDGVDIKLWSSRTPPRPNHIFLFSLATLNEGPVKCEYWKGAAVTFFAKDSGYPDATKVGYIDALDTTVSIANNYAMQITSYFVAPQTGFYTFKASCDDHCQIYLSESEDPALKKKIINIKSSKGRNGYGRSDQVAEKIRLTVEKKYFIQGRLIEKGGGDFMQIAVVLPSGEFVAPITYDYLRRRDL